jgi:hypothetical protein
MKNKKSSKIKKLLPILFLVGIGLVLGVFVGVYTETIAASTSSGNSIGERLFSMAFLFIAAYIAFFLQIIVHEGGHLLFGLMTGYGFSSFRVGSFMWIKQEGKIKVKRFSLVGTGGQCLLTPPEMKDGNYPYILYNFGGSILNLVVGAVFILLAVVTRDSNLVSKQFMLLGVVGAAYALINGIPFQLENVNNDGHNAISLGKNKEALRSFWVQLKVNEQITAGVRLKSMPEEWFEIPSEESMKNSITSVMGVFACNRMMDQMKFEEAEETIEKLLDMDTGIVGLHKHLMVCDQIYCQLIGENNQEKISSLVDKKQKKFMEAMKRFPSVVRTEYVYALLKENNPVKANQIKEKFTQIANKYPYSSEIAMEFELMTYAESVKEDILQQELQELGEGKG